MVRFFAYMPADGEKSTPDNKYSQYWKNFATDYDAEFVYFDNSLRGEEAQKEIKKIMDVDILLISGGNTFTLLNNLRQTGMDKAIQEFSKMPGKVLAGFSAGAIVLSPSIDTASAPLEPDSNGVGLKDMSGLGIIDFEVIPHYDPVTDKEKVEEYKSSRVLEVKTLTGDEVLVIRN